MSTMASRIRKWEFEARIFISLSLVATVAAVSYAIHGGNASTLISIGRAAGLTAESSLRYGYLVVALILAFASVFRMWAGSMLQSDRIMAFKVQADALIIVGPYRLVRNPIYLADLVAFFGFGLCLPPAGMLMPLVIYLHYVQIIKHEEVSLLGGFGESYRQYSERVSRIIPHPRAVRQLGTVIRQFEINRDGLRHNALYVLFIAGFIVASVTGELLHALFIGMPAVVDWGLLHSRKGLVDPAAEATARGETRSEVIAEAEVFSDMLYASCWEDPRIDREAFRIGPDDVVFSITSGGCNTLTFLLDDPERVIALDLNPHQNHMLELKMRAFEVLDHGELLEIMGVNRSERRGELYERIRPLLSAESRGFWDNRPEKIEEGLIYCGRYEDYMKLLRKWFGRLVGRKVIHEFFEADGTGSRAALFREKWENLRWRVFTRVLLSRAVMSLLFDKAFFTFVEESFSFGKHFAGRVEHALTRLPLKDNYFLSFMLLGRYFSEEHLPPYLRRENFEFIRERVGKIEIVEDDCGSYFRTLPDRSISKFNFTNIFEWMSPEDFEELLAETVRVARNGAILTYRNLLVSRERPQSMRSVIHPLRPIAERLHEEDLSFIYKRYVVERVWKAGA